MGYCPWGRRVIHDWATKHIVYIVFKTGIKWQVYIIFSILHLGGYISESPYYIIIANLVLQLGYANKWLKRLICTSAKRYKVNLCYLTVIFDILGYFKCYVYLDAFLLTWVIHEILWSKIWHIHICRCSVHMCIVIYKQLWISKGIYVICICSHI